MSHLGHLFNQPFIVSKDSFVSSSLSEKHPSLFLRFLSFILPCYYRNYIVKSSHLFHFYIPQFPLRISILLTAIHSVTLYLMVKYFFQHPSTNLLFQFSLLISYDYNGFRVHDFKITPSKINPCTSSSSFRIIMLNRLNKVLSYTFYLI